MVFREGREWSFEECRARSMGIESGGKDIWEGMGESNLLFFFRCGFGLDDASN